MNARDWFYGPQGFGSTRGNVPSGASISKADAMLSKTARGICLHDECMRLADGEDGLCTDHRKENA